MKRFSKMFAMFIIFVGLVVILSCSNQLQDISSDITYDFSSDGEPIDVIILAGQSNATGCCFSEDLRGYVSPEDFELFTNGFENQKIIWYLDWSNHSLPSLSSGLTNVKLGQGFSNVGFGPEIGISYVMNEVNKRVIIIKYSSPGSGIDTFINSNGLNKNFEFFIANSLYEICNIGYNPKIKCICWMQGETDSSYEYEANLYEQREKNLILAMRKKFGTEIAFIDAKITDWYLVMPNCYQEVVNKAKTNISHSKLNSYLINSNGLTKLEDLMHYNARSQFELGKRFGEMILSKCY